MKILSRKEKMGAMDQTQTTVTLPGVQKLVQQIVDRFHPQKVILFGSHAYGKPTEDSDVDLLVVMQTEENPLHTAARISASVDHPFPLDILVIRPSDLAAALQEQNIFETEVVNKGVILYEAEDPGVDQQGGRRLDHGPA
jgi:predicted nucleotidyltransferase